MRASLLLPLSPFLLLLSSLIAVTAQTGTPYTFCFSSTQTLPTSPSLPWQVTMSGTLLIDDRATSLTYGNYGSYITGSGFDPSQQLQGYPVLNATGTRSIVRGGSTTAITSTIVNIAPVGAYSANDNIIGLTSPYFDNLAHGLAFILSAQPTFAYGQYGGGNGIQGSGVYTNINNYSLPIATGAGVGEIDNPPNDGNANVISSTFTLTKASAYPGTPLLLLPHCTRRPLRCRGRLCRHHHLGVLLHLHWRGQLRHSQWPAVVHQWSGNPHHH